MKTHDPACEGLMSTIETAFGYLLRDRKFTVLHAEASTRGDRCLAVLEGAFRIKFILDRGSLEVLVGGRHAPLGWGDFSDGHRRWFQAWGAINKAGGKPKPSSGAIMEFGNKVLQMKQGEYIRYLAASLHEALDDISRAFSSDELGEETRLEEYFYSESAAS